MNKSREIFGQRAAYYTTSVSHTDKEVLDRSRILLKLYLKYGES